MFSKKKVKNKLESGVGEFMAFQMCVILLMFIYLIILATAGYDNSLTVLEESSQKIARDIVTCQSFQEAQETAQEDLNKIEMPTIGDKRVIVEYSPGSEQEWKKGNYINVTVVGRIRNNIIRITEEKEAMTLMMIERNEDEDA